MAIIKPMAHRNKGLDGEAGFKGHLDRDLAHDYRRTFGMYVAAARRQAGLTQAELAEAIGVGFTAISAVETGRGSLPPERYEAVAEALNIDKQEFGKHILRWSNPWLYKLVYNSRERRLLEDLAEVQERVGRSTFQPLARGN